LAETFHFPKAKKSKKREEKSDAEQRVSDAERRVTEDLLKDSTSKLSGIL